MKLNKKYLRFFSFFIIVAMIVTMIPQVSFAADKKESNEFKVLKESQLEETTYRSNDTRTYNVNMTSRGLLTLKIERTYDSYDEIYNDPQVTVYDKNYNELWYNYNSYHPDTSQYVYNYIGLMSGNYIVEVSMPDIYTLGSSAVQFNMKAGNYEIEPNYDIATATRMYMAKTYTGHLTEEEADVYKVYLQKGKRYKLTVGNYRSIHMKSYYDFIDYYLDDELDINLNQNGNSYVYFTVDKTGFYEISLNGRYNNTQFKYTLKVEEPYNTAPKNMYSRLSTSSGGYDDIYTVWSKVPSASGYYVYYRRPYNSTSWTYLGKTTGTSYLKKNLYNGYRYEFKVAPYKIVNGISCKSLRYATSYANTLKKVSTPSVTKYNSSKTKVRWRNIYGESGYQISRSTSKTGTYIVSTYTTTRGTYKTLTTTRNKSYYYKVRAFRNVIKNGKTYRVYAPWSSVRLYTLR